MASFKKKIINALLTLLLLILLFVTFLITPWGRPVLKTLLLVPEVVPNFPIRPLKFFSREPTIEEITLKVGDKDIKADLYKPNDNKKHPAVVFTLGTIVTRKDEAVTKFAQSLSRSGFIVLVPDLPDFLSGFVWTDSVETLTSSVEFLDKQPFVNRQKIGFAGFCVGASASIIAAEDSAIADKVSFISAISPYFDMRAGSEAVVTGHAKNSNGDLVVWQPAQISKDAVVRGFVNAVGDENERILLRTRFLEDKALTVEQINGFSQGALSIYNFLGNTDPAKSDEVWDGMPGDYKDIISELSPSTKINNLKAKIFVLNDK